MEPVQSKWWDDCVRTDVAPYYRERGGASDNDEKRSSGQLLWGDRVRILEADTGDGAVKVCARGIDVWVNATHLGGEPLLELYIIDVGQGDGLLLVTPEGHHVMVDGGNLRKVQNGGKNAADFVDWKFFDEYSLPADRADGVSIHLDAMIASHCDQDHFGGLWDLIDRTDPKNAAELDCSAVTIEAFYHAGLSWWFDRWDGNSAERWLGPVQNEAYTQVLGDRAGAEAATANLDTPDRTTLSGGWGKLIAAVAASRRSDGELTNIQRLSHASGWLPGFAPDDDGSEVAIRVLGPIELERNGAPALQRYEGGTSKNTNGHSIVLRVDYGDRRLLLTGDLNTASQHQIMETYGPDFTAAFGCDVAKGCHHGSHDVSVRFLDGLKPVATVISSGDAETHDHPRPTILAASVLTSRKLFSVDGDQVIAPLLYATEIARSVQLADVVALRAFDPPTPKYVARPPTGAEHVYDSEDEKSRFRLYLSERPSAPRDFPRLDAAKVVRGLTYGLVNVRTDGTRLLFAVREESGPDWAVEVIEGHEIETAA